MLGLSRSAALLLVVAVPELPAQVSVTLADSPAVAIMTRVGSKASAAWLRDILRQARRPQPQAKLDEIADSLVGRAIDPASADQRSAAYDHASEALLALVSAGSDAPLGGLPYAGAFERLVRVHQQGRSPIRGKALAGLLAVSHSRAVQYLSEVAESTDSTAYNAIDFLMTDANGGSWVGGYPTASEQQESAAALKALASRGRVTHADATELLRMWIARNP